MNTEPEQSPEHGDASEFHNALRRLAVSENGFLFDPSSGNSFTLNATGLVLLRLLQEGRSPAAIIALLAEEYDVSPAKLEQDLLEFTASLRRCLALSVDSQ